MLFAVSYIALWLLVVLLFVSMVLVYRHFGLVIMSTGEGHDRDGLEVGTAAPEISGVDEDNQRRFWQPAAGGHLLVFTLPGCEPCERIAPILGKLSTELAKVSDITVTVITTGRADAVHAFRSLMGTGPECLADDGSGAMDRYLVNATPFGFVLDERGLVQSKGRAADPGKLRSLLESAGRNAEVAVLESMMSEYREVTSTGAERAT